MTAEYAAEEYASFIEEMKPLLSEHWRELALFQEDIPLEPDYEFYEKAHNMGLIRTYTVRVDGRLLGYAMFRVLYHSHYKSHRWADCDIIWVHPEHRNAGVGNGLFEFLEEHLRRDGPIVIHVTAKCAHPELSYLLASRGYAMVEVGHSRRFA